MKLSPWDRALTVISVLDFLQKMADATGHATEMALKSVVGIGA
jgi:hypothetical protein